MRFSLSFFRPGGLTYSSMGLPTARVISFSICHLKRWALSFFLCICLSFLFFYIKRILVASGLQCVLSILTVAGSVNWWIFWASPSWLHYTDCEELAFGPWMQPRKGNQGWGSRGEVMSDQWPLNPVSPPQLQYLCLQLCGDCRPGRLPLQMSPRHLFMHPSKPMVQSFLPPSAEKDSVMKSVFGYTAGVRNVFGIGCCTYILGHNPTRRTGSGEDSPKNTGSKEQSLLAFVRQFLRVSVGW